MSEQNQYDLYSVKLPLLGGTLLNLVAALLESGLTRWLLLGQFLENSGINKLRTLIIEDAPTFFPPTPTLDEAPGAPADLGTLPTVMSAAPGGFKFATVRDYAEAYRGGDITPEDVAQRVLDAIAESGRSDPPLGAMIAVDPADVMEQARISAERLKAGNPLSVLDGVPVAVKDEVDMCPYGTTVGTSFLGKEPATADSTVVKRLRDAGAILIGKTNMHEIGITTTGLNMHHGTPRNPYNPAHYTGGSSSGPGAVVAAGLCPFAVGADGGGSIRIPAAFCGVTGIKATFGRISETGAAPLAWSVGHVGPLAATTEDLALAYVALSGPCEHDPYSQHQPLATLDDFNNLDLSGFRMGIYRPWFEHADPEIVAACSAMLEKFTGMGVELLDIVIPELDDMRIAHTMTILSEMSTGMDKYYDAHHREFDGNTRVLLALARTFNSVDYVKAQRIRTRAVRYFEEALAQVDVILTPTTAVTAPPISEAALRGGESDTSLVVETMRFAFAANLTGHPAISFPVGYTAAGLPIGMQAIGRYWQEHTLLRFANAAEQHVPRQKPQIHFDIL